MLDIVNIMLAFAVALTYPLQFYAAIEVLEKKVGLADDPAAEGLGLPTAPQQPRGRQLKAAGFRFAVVLCTFAVAALVPKLGPMIALFGALFGGAIELILPPALYLISNVGAGRRSLLAINWSLLVVGVGVVIVGTYSAVQELAAKPTGKNGTQNIGYEVFGPSSSSEEVL